MPHGPEFPVEANGFQKPHAPFLNERRIRGLVQGSVQEIRGVRPGVHGPKTMGAAPRALLLFDYKSPFTRMDILLWHKLRGDS